MLQNKRLISKINIVAAFGLNIIFGMCFVWCVYAQDSNKYDSGGRRNPFIALVTPDGRLLKLDREKQGQSKFIVEGIIFDKNGISYAIINSIVAGIGDQVEDYQVLKIKKDAVILIKEGQPLRIEFNSDNIIKEEK